MENQPTHHDILGVEYLVDQMTKAGFTRAATNVATRTLKRKNLIDFTQIEESYYNDSRMITHCFLTELGVEWLINNQDKIRIKFDASERDIPM
ncbi:hypothetical protein [Dyadobacter bucti]|uniref:hypothetical protein n=1 Tax=Dyadobacter bucti TaxID=2572203 RepID=UPI0011084614|nr:hypothetical protein [Dyadobacter bucti]